MSPAMTSSRSSLLNSTIRGYGPAAQQRLRACLFAELDRLQVVDGRAIDRLEHLVRGSVVLLANELPFVTLLLRVRATRRPNARRSPGAASSTISSPNWWPRPPPRVTCAPTSTRRWPRLLFGMVNSLIEWYRPRGAAAADDLAATVVAAAFDGLRVRPS